jgi:TRAP-type C4-dicarboxylate transport system permease small subunit
VKFFERFLDGLAVLAAILILVIMVGVAVDVFSRSLINRPIGWVLEYTEHGLLLILLLGMPRLVRGGEHVGIDLFLNLMRPKPAWAMRIIAEFAAGAACAIVSIAAGFAARNDYISDVETFGIYPMPRYLLMIAVAIGLLLTAIEFFRLMVRSIARGSLVSAPEEADHLMTLPK